MPFSGTLCRVSLTQTQSHSSLSTTRATRPPWGSETRALQTSTLGCVCASVCPGATVPCLQDVPAPPAEGRLASPSAAHHGCAAVLGDDESILLAGPQISQMQRWHGLNQQGLCVPAPCLQRQSRHLLCNAPLRYLRADGSLVPNAPEDLGFLLLSQLGPRFDSSSGAIRLGNVRNVLHVGRV